METLIVIFVKTKALAEAIAAAVPAIVGTFSILAALLPPPDDRGGFLGKVHGFINKVAFNFNHAKNAQ